MATLTDPDFDFPEESLIAYPRFKELYDSILDCQELTRSSGDPHCIAIEGELGVGKSTLVKAFVKASLKDSNKNKAKPSGIYVMTPESKHPAAIASAILEQLGDPFPERGRVWAQKHRIKRFVRDLNVSTACFDEFHHLWDKAHDRVLYDESEYVKMFIKGTEKTLVATGKKDGITPILEANKELSSLFISVKQLDPFQWDAEHAPEFDKLISTIENQLKRKIETPLSREEILGRIHYATDGVLRHLCRLLRSSNLFARRDESDAIGLKHLSKGYDEMLATHFKNKRNPFNLEH